MVSPVQIKFVNKDIQDVEGDIITLKYARDNYGLSKEILSSHPEIEEELFKSSLFDVTLCEHKNFKVNNILFVHLPLNTELEYTDINKFFQIMLSHLKVNNNKINSIITTIQGADFLDEQYSLQCQIEGIFEALKNNIYPNTLKQIIIAESDTERYDRLIGYSKIIFNQCETFVRRLNHSLFEIAKIPYSFKFNKLKEKHIFVAMPFSDDFEDHFYYGIEDAIKQNGYLSLRIDKHKFIGDIIKEMIEKIETADAVIADLSTANANVYLELGFAWGKNIKTFLIIRDINELKFDVKGRRCLEYKSIRDLNKKLSEELKELLKR